MITSVHNTPNSTVLPAQLDFVEASVHEKSSRIVQAILSNQFSRQKAEWTRRVTQISPHDLGEIIGLVCQELCSAEDPIKPLNRLAKILPLKELQDVVRAKYPHHTDALKAAKDMFLEAKYYLEKTEKEHSTPFWVRIWTFLDSLVIILETYLSALGIVDLLTPSEDSMLADHKMYKLTMLIALPGSFLTVLTPLLGPQLAALIVGGLCLTIVTLSLILPLIRPTPTILPMAENWTKKIQEGKIVPLEGRDKTIDAIAQTLISSKTLATHPLLIGRSGIGKTEAVKAFANAVLEGQYPELKGKQVFYINTADLIDCPRRWGDNASIFSRISSAMGRHRENIILVFDEIHLACQQREESSIAEQLKLMLDPGSEKFPHVIGITTEEEYYRDIFVNNAAFARRFSRITVENTNESETLTILNNTLMREAPKLIPDEGILPTLLKKTQEAFSENAPQPATSLKILSRAIQKTRESQKSPLEEKIEKIREEIKYQYSQGTVEHGSGLLPYNKADRCSIIEPLEAELDKLEKKFDEQEKRLSVFYRMRDLLPTVKRETFRTVLKVANVEQSHLSESDRKNLNRFLLMSHFFAPTLTTKLKDEATTLGVKTTLDAMLINSVIAEEKENEKRAKEEIARGQNQIRERSA